MRRFWPNTSPTQTAKTGSREKLKYEKPYTHFPTVYLSASLSLSLSISLSLSPFIPYLLLCSTFVSFSNFCFPHQMFYRENLERALERQRNIELREVCRKIYYVILTVVARRKFLQAKARIVQCQKFVKVHSSFYLYNCLYMICTLLSNVHACTCMYMYIMRVYLLWFRTSLEFVVIK